MRKVCACMQQLCARQVMVLAWLNTSSAMYTARQQNLGTAGVDVMLKYVDITVKIITVTQSLSKHTKSRLPLLEQMGCVQKSVLKEVDLIETLCT